MKLTALFLIPLAASAAEGDAFFRERVEPLLKQRCFECHSHAGKIKGGLVLDSRSGWQAGGDSGAALVPGSPEKSHLIEAVRYANPDMEMPPKAKLPESEIAVLEEWVKRGAPDPRETVAVAKAVKKAGVDVEEGRKHWSYQPVRDTAPPAVHDQAWPLNEVDAFILAKQEAAGLQPGPEAGEHAWLRRVTFDLTGLPPTEAEIADFVTDRSPKAHERVVDRLLSSRAYGERWARHWLDLVGYAEQIGTEGKVFAEHAWRYRDYLVDSFHQDKPFDRFIREQLAGDLLPAASPQERRENLIATGFIVLGDVDINAIDKLKMEHDFVDSQVSKVGTAFLGMTLGCVRCHDHKFDAIGQQDYYALAGMFRSTKTTFKTGHGIWSNIQRVPLPKLEEDQVAARSHDQKLAGWRKEKQKLEAESKALGDKPDAAGKKRLDELKKELTALELRIGHGEYFHPGKPQAIAVQDTEKPADMRVTIRGNPYALGDTMPRGLVRVAMWGPQPTIPAGQSGRLQLADWIADARHPLTARIAVNRVWQKLFGEGLVRSVDYFGTRGDAPSHPELLDHLAHRFMQEDWSQKKLIRMLALSRTYRLSSDGFPTDSGRPTDLKSNESQSVGFLESVGGKDTENKLLTRMNRQRLDAESIRDAMLVASGRLAAPSGGPGLPLEFPENISGLPLKVKQDVHPQFSLKKERESQMVERTLYLPVVRTGTQPGTARLRDVFDFPQPAQFTSKRSETTVPTQSLYLLNADLIRERGEDLAKMLLAIQENDAARLARLWLRVLNRPITAAEREDALTFLQASKAAGETQAWTELARALFGTNEFLLRF
ncbi:MAG: PSD1 and planctomycete cytochrome C domain-containing protein [Verrucomicrobiota bacterium]|nr:PSD1 and planctomycete cytochrome C domain-containing protein [Verrucomicrobiota bacterium]